MENKNYDLKLAGYIWSILKTQPVIVMSWGVDMDTIKPVKGGLEFHVQGFKHTGMVKSFSMKERTCLKYILSLTLKEKEK